MNNQVENVLKNSKTIAMVGVSSLKKKEDPKNLKRKPSIIVMKYMQDYGYKVIPVNPFAAGETIYGELVVAALKDIKSPVDIVDVFRPSIEAPVIAEQAAKIGAKSLWLQYGIKHKMAKKIAIESNMNYFENLCIKQEYQKIFEKMIPVFPVLKS
jgi:predicted CoA-binding protein